MEKKRFVFNYACIITLSANLLALTSDGLLTWSSPILPKLYSNDSSINPLGAPITKTEESWIGSLVNIGAIFGVAPFCYLADKIGRKYTLLMLAVPHIVAFVMFAFATNIYLFYVGRILGGIALSSMYLVLPMYLAEISEDSYRGVLLVSVSTFASFGDLVPYIIGPYVSIFWFNMILAMFPLAFMVSFAWLAPESPYYYVRKHNVTAAKESLMQLRFPNLSSSSYHHRHSINKQIDMELEKIDQEVHKEDYINKWTMCKSRTVIKGFLISSSLNSLQQLTGIAAVLAYTQIIFEEAGSNISADVSSIIVGLVLFGASFCGPLLVDRKGRKFLLICSSGGMVVSETLLGVYFYLKHNTTFAPIESIAWLPIMCLIVFTITYNIGFGPLPFTISSEILPTHVKFVVCAITGTFGWLVSFLVTRFFNDLNDSVLGKAGTYWLFSGFCVLALVFAVFVLPETKGKSFQEIQNILSK